MSTILTSTGITFPDSTTQPTATQFVKISSATGEGAAINAYREWTGLYALGYNAYRLHLAKFNTGSAQGTMRLHVSNNAGTWQTGAYYYNNRFLCIDSSITYMPVAYYQQASAFYGLVTGAQNMTAANMIIEIFNCQNNSMQPLISMMATGSGSSVAHSGSWQQAHGYNTNVYTGVDGFRIYNDTDTWTCNWSLYGMKYA